MLLRPAGNKSTSADEKELFKINNANASVWTGDWTLGSVHIPPQSRDYRLVLEARTCAGRCKKSRFIALDDFRFFHERCADIDVQTVWPNRELSSLSMYNI